MTFTYHTPESAPQESKPMLEGAQKSFGMIPNLHAILAEGPTTYEAYGWLYNKFTTSTSFSPLEQQVVMMTSNVENKCHYCVPAHTWIMKSAKMPEDVIEALRTSKELPDAKLQALSDFTKAMWDNRGHVSQDQLKDFLNAGYSNKHAIELMTGMACKLISNFTNGMTKTKVDAPFQEFI